MPGDQGDEIGAPALCNDHRPVIRALTRMDHVGDEDSARTATQLATQCPQCRALREPS